MCFNPLKIISEAFHAFVRTIVEILNRNSSNNIEDAKVVCNNEWDKISPYKDIANLLVKELELPANLFYF